MTATDSTRLDSPFIRPFIDAAIRTLEVQCQMIATAGDPFSKGSTQQEPVDIAAVIALNSQVLLGSAAFCFPKSTYLSILSRMLGETYLELTEELHDGASELLNITFGHAKVILNEQGYGLEKAIPTIVAGENIQVRHLARGQTVVIPFEWELGRFYLELAVALPRNPQSQEN